MARALIPAPRLLPMASAEDVARRAARFIAACCMRAVRRRGVFHWVLAGGTTPARCYRMLRDCPLPWHKVHCWFGDERLLPEGHPERNETMARRALLDHVPIPDAQIHAIPYADDAEQAAMRYARALADWDTPPFDLVLLGMGEDGHTASLFPGQAEPAAGRWIMPVADAPKPPARRVSLTHHALNQHRHGLMLITGESKKHAVQRILHGEPLPAARIERAYWLIDRKAWPSEDKSDGWASAPRL